MSHQWTVEIEARDGEPLDIEEVREALERMGVKLTCWAPGVQMLALTAWRRAKQDMEAAFRMALPLDEGGG